MGDWRLAHVGNARLGVSRSIAGYAQQLEGEVSQQHPGHTWVERQEGSARHPLKQPPTASECGHNLLQMVINENKGGMR